MPPTRFVSRQRDIEQSKLICLSFNILYVVYRSVKLAYECLLGELSREGLASADVITSVNKYTSASILCICGYKSAIRYLGGRLLFYGICRQFPILAFTN